MELSNRKNTSHLKGKGDKDTDNEQLGRSIKYRTRRRCHQVMNKIDYG
jgi:hypothetical protein